jgi:hypothetical protein
MSTVLVLVLLVEKRGRREVRERESARWRVYVLSASWESVGLMERIQSTGLERPSRWEPHTHQCVHCSHRSCICASMLMPTTHCARCSVKRVHVQPLPSPVRHVERM